MGNSNSNPQKELPKKKSKISRIKQNLTCFNSEEEQLQRVCKSKHQLATRQQEHYGVLNVKAQGENLAPKLATIDNSIKIIIFEFLVLEEIINLRLTCRKLNSFICRSPEVNFNILAYKVLSPQYAPLLIGIQSKEIINTFLIPIQNDTLKKNEFVEIIKIMIKEYTQKMLICRQLEKTDFKISDLYKILSKPQIPVTNFNPDLEYDFSESWFQYEQNSEIQQDDHMSKSQQELHNILEDPSDLIEMRFVLIQDLIIQNNLQLEDQECPILFQGVHSFLHSLHFHCTNLVSMMKMIDTKNNFGFIQYFVYAWNAYQGSMFELKKYMDPFLSNFDQIFQSYYVVPEWLQKSSFTSEQIMRRMWCIKIMNDQKIQERLIYSFQNLHRELLESSVRNNVQSEFQQDEKSAISQYGYKTFIQIMKLFVRGILDLCCTQDNIKWLGHSRFPLQKITKNILSSVEENLIKFYQDLCTNSNTPHDLMNIMEIEQEINCKLFPKWIYESKFLPLTCKLVSQHIELTSNTEIKVIKEDEEFLIESTEEPDRLNRFCQIQGALSVTDSMIAPQSAVTSTTLTQSTRQISQQFSQQFSQIVFKSGNQESSSKTIIKEISSILQKTEDFTKLRDETIEDFNKMDIDQYISSLEMEKQKILDPFQIISTCDILPFLTLNQKTEFEILDIVEKCQSNTQQTKFVHLKNNKDFKSLAELINRTSGVKK